MLLEIAQRFNMELEGVPLVGDSLRDLQAAEAVGAQPMLVLTGKGTKTREAGGLPAGTAVYPDLAAFAAQRLHDAVALGALRARARPRHPALRDPRALSLSAAAHGALSPHLRLVAADGLAGWVLCGIRWRVEGRKQPAG